MGPGDYKGAIHMVGTSGVADKQESEALWLSIHQRIHAVMKDVGHLDKDKVHAIMKDGRKVGEFPYISHDLVSAHLRPAFIKHGIVTYSNVVGHGINGNRTEIQVETTFVCADPAPDMAGAIVAALSITTFGYGVDKGDKGIGKAYSYAVKYALMKTFMLNSADDVEAESVDHVGAASEADVAAAKEETAKAQGRVNELDQKVCNRIVSDIADANSLERVDEIMAEQNNFSPPCPAIPRHLFKTKPRPLKTRWKQRDDLYTPTPPPWFPTAL